MAHEYELNLVLLRQMKLALLVALSCAVYIAPCCQAFQYQSKLRYVQHSYAFTHNINHVFGTMYSFQEIYLGLALAVLLNRSGHHTECWSLSEQLFFSSGCTGRGTKSGGIVLYHASWPPNPLLPLDLEPLPT